MDLLVTQSVNSWRACASVLLLIAAIAKTGFSAPILTADSRIARQTAVLLCDLDLQAEPVQTVYWYRNVSTAFTPFYIYNSSLDSSAVEDPRVAGKLYNVSTSWYHSINISEVTLGDAGEYRCEVKGGDNVTRTAEAVLDVTASVASVTVTSPSSVPGDDVTLVCDYVIDMSPLYELTWWREPAADPGNWQLLYKSWNNTETLSNLNANSTVTWQNTGGDLSSELTMPNVQATTEEGTYKCVVTDDADVTTENTTVFDITVGCESSPCQNGATCEDTSDSFICHCAETYTGSTCNTDIEYCISSSCSNGGTCVEGAGSSTSCTCTTCFTGDSCTDYAVNPCMTSTPCENGGKCVVDCSGYTCDCTPNWAGSTCTDTCNNVANISSGVSVILGTSTTLFCEGVANANTVWWSKDSTGSPSLLTGTELTTTALTSDDTFHCFVLAGGCESRRSVTVTTYYEIIPNKTSASSKEVKEGEDLTLDCSADGKPVPIIQWIFVASQSSQKEDDDTELTGNTTRAPPAQDMTTAPAERTPLNNGTAREYRLVISDVQMENAGTYECVAVLAGTTTLTIKKVDVTVVEGGGKGLKIWMIAVIAAGGLLIIIIIVVIVILICKKKNSGNNGRRTSTVGPLTGKTPQPPSSFANNNTENEVKKKKKKKEIDKYEQKNETKYTKHTQKREQNHSKQFGNGYTEMENKKKKNVRLDKYEQENEKDNYENDRYDREDEDRRARPKSSRRRQSSDGTTPRPLPALNAAGGRMRALPPLDMDLEHEKTKKKKKKKKKVPSQTTDDLPDNSRFEEDDRYYQY